MSQDRTTDHEETQSAVRRDGEALRRERRASLLDAADDALRAEGPEVSMDAVAARAGVTKPILYRHFGDRGGLMAAVTRRHAEWLLASIREALAEQADPRERIHVTLDTYLGFLEADPALHRATARLGASPNGARSTLDEAQDMVCAEVTANVAEELRKAGLDPLPAETWGPAIVGMARLVGSRWLASPDTPRRELADRLTTLVWHGFASLVPGESALP